MNEPHDRDRTVDVPSSPADSLDAGLAAGFSPPRSSLGDLRPVLLKEAEGDSAHIVKPKSDAMPPPELTGDRYQLQGEIARGGMGAVLRGRDVDLGRDLAVKVLLEKHAHRPEVARRFIEEAQIGGQLQHPGVVPVYDIGRFGQRPFFTMKLVKGQTLAALLSERTDPAADRPRFLTIALQVAQALAYAHAKGVIHRDLKPANVMVGAFGEVQVMDWGLAKVLAEGGVADEEKASRERERPEGATEIRTARSSGSAGTFGTQTEAGSLVGTPAYMPPEQANGEVANLDRRADVFGLGAILCEILTGKPPYVGPSSEEVRRKACNGDLADAMTRLESCGADAELIALTKGCLSAEAIDRPKDGQAVADQLTGYLNGVQERLHQAELAEAHARAKAIEEAKRRRLTLALAGTVLLALTLGGGGWLWVKNERETRQTLVAREVNDALHKATALREQAKGTTTGGAALFAQAREQASRALALVENGPAEDTLKAQVQGLKAELDDEEKDRTFVAALDAARLAQAETLSGENRFATEQAVPKFRAAFRAYGLPAGEGDPAAVAEHIRRRPPAIREAILAALDEWDVLAGRPKHPIAEPHRKWLQAVLAAAEPPDAWSREVRAALAKQTPARRQLALESLAASVDVRKMPVRALTQLANWGQSTDGREIRPSEAAKLLRRAQRQYPADFWVNEKLGMILQEVTPPEREEAVRFLTAAVALRSDSPGALLNLSSALKATGQLDEAIACLRKAVALDPKYAAAHSNLGWALRDKGQVDEAIACYQKAIELDPRLAVAHSNLGHALFAKGQLDRAIACYRKAVQLDLRDAIARSNLGDVLRLRGELDEAIASCRKAIALDPKYAGAHGNLGLALYRKGQVDEAIACYQRALALDPRAAIAHSNLGTALSAKGRVDEAIACHQRAIALDPKYAEGHYNLGTTLHNKGRVDEAIACYQKAIALNPKAAEAHVNLGNALTDKSQVDEAIACYQKAIALNPKLALAHFNLARALADRSRVDAAIACYQKALALDPKYADAHNKLGAILCDFKRDYDGAIACFQKALALNPKLASAHCNLGNALRHKGQVDAAIACFQKAIALDQKFAKPHVNLGAILCDVKRNYDAAIACFKKAIEIAPKDALAHHNLGNALEAKGQVDAAITCWRKALELDPKLPLVHYYLGGALRRKGQVDEAIACYRKVIALDPKHARAYADLATALESKGRFEDAIVCARKAIALDPKLVFPHFNLGLWLARKGQLDEAIVCFRKAIELDPNHAPAYGALGKALLANGQCTLAREATARALVLLAEKDPLRASVSRQLQNCEHFAKLEARLPRLLAGADKPASIQESLDITDMCRAKRMHAAVARFSAYTFAKVPALANQLQAALRYNAACAAALAAAGQGEDAARLDNQERTRLRKQSLDWLRADLALWTKRLKSGKSADRAAARPVLRHWQGDRDLAGLRDPAALARLPAEERAAFTQLWAEVAALLKKTEPPAKKDTKR
jgi:serine/threonine-protein kinase